MTRAVSTLGSSTSSSSEPEGRWSSSTESSESEVSESSSGLRTRRPPALGPYAPNIWRCLRLGPPPPRSATKSASPSSGPYRPPLAPRALPPPPTWLFESDAEPPPRPPRPRPRPPSPRVAPRPRPPRPPRPAGLWRPPMRAHSGMPDHACPQRVSSHVSSTDLRQKRGCGGDSRAGLGGRFFAKANARGGSGGYLAYKKRVSRGTHHAPSPRAPSPRPPSFRFTARCTLLFHSSRRLCISSNCSFDCSWVGER